MEEPSERKIIEMEELIMGVYDELKARGLIAQLTNEEKVRDLLNNERPAFISVLIQRLTACMSVTLFRLW